MTDRELELAVDLERCIHITGAWGDNSERYEDAAKELMRSRGWMRGHDAKCRWTEDSDGNWKTECGDLFVFIQGGPMDNNCKYCHYCGRPIDEKPWTEADDDDE